MGLFLPNSIKKRGEVSPVGATAFAFATGGRYFPVKTIIDRK